MESVKGRVRKAGLAGTLTPSRSVCRGTEWHLEQLLLQGLLPTPPKIPLRFKGTCIFTLQSPCPVRMVY